MSRISTPHSNNSSHEDLTIAPERAPTPQTPLAEETAAELTLEETIARFALAKEQRTEIKNLHAEKNESCLFAKNAELKRVTEEKRLAEEEKKKAEAEKQATLNSAKFAFADKKGSGAEEKTNQGCKCTIM